MLQAAPSRKPQHAVAVPEVSDGFASAPVASVSAVSCDSANQVEMETSFGVRGLWARIGHSHDKRRRNRFVRIMQLGYRARLSIPDGAASLLEGNKVPLPRFINLQPRTGCSWQLALEREDGMLVLALPWFIFVKFHGLLAKCVLEFKVVHPDVMTVNIYYKTDIEMRYKECEDEKLLRKVL